MRTRESLAQLAARCREDFGAFAYDGFGVMLSDGQVQARADSGPLGPRGPDDAKFHFFSGGQRAGKTVYLGLAHADANLYKRGLDNTDRVYWLNYQYKTLAIAPSTELTLKLYVVMDELAKGASDAQFDRRARRARGGRMLGMMRAGKVDRWGIVRYEYGGATDFRSSEGRAVRLEGGQWWGVTWDEWASQPPHEIPYVLEDVLMGRARDHDAKIWPAAWPKEETEHLLIAVEREIETGREKIKGAPKRITYMSAESAHFTNQRALSLEKDVKDEAKYKRTVLGRPAGGAMKEFKRDVIANMVIKDLPIVSLPDEDPVPGDGGPGEVWRYFVSADLGVGQDETVFTAWRIPKSGVTPQAKARIKQVRILPPGDNLTLDIIAAEAKMLQLAYERADVAVDASGMGGVMAIRQMSGMKPKVIGFVSTGNHRLYGNVRLAAITNALEMLSWGRDPERPDLPWGLVESPPITELTDQMGYFDRDAKNQADDRVWSFIIGLWYIRRYWVRGEAHRHTGFDPRMMQPRRVVPFITAR